MPALSFLEVSCTGHGGYPPRANTGPSATNVYVNGIKVHIVGDVYPTHCTSPPDCHDGTLASGSSTVFVNGQPAGRIGDNVSCGSIVSQGSPNVFVGG